MLDPLQLQLWMVVSGHVGVATEPGASEKQPILLTTEPALQSQNPFSQSQPCLCLYPSLGKQRQGGPWGVLAKPA